MASHRDRTRKGYFPPSVNHSSSEEEQTDQRRRGPIIKSSRKVNQGHEVIDLTSDQSDSIAVDDGQRSMGPQTLNSASKLSRVKSPATLRSQPQRDSVTESEQRSTKRDVASPANPSMPTDSSYQTMHNFLEPSEKVLDLVQAKSGFLWAPRQRRSLKDGWGRVINLDSVLETVKTSQTPHEYTSEFDETLKEFQKTDRHNLIYAIKTIRADIEASDERRRQNADGGLGLGRVIARKTIPEDGGRSIRPPGARPRESARNSASQQSVQNEESGGSHKTPETVRNRGKTDHLGISKKHARSPEPKATAPSKKKTDEEESESDMQFYDPETTHEHGGSIHEAAPRGGNHISNSTNYELAHSNEDGATQRKSLGYGTKSSGDGAKMYDKPRTMIHVPQAANAKPGDLGHVVNSKDSSVAQGSNTRLETDLPADSPQDFQKVHSQELHTGRGRRSYESSPTMVSTRRTANPDQPRGAPTNTADGNAHADAFISGIDEEEDDDDDDAVLGSTWDAKVANKIDSESSSSAGLASASNSPQRHFKGSLRANNDIVNEAGEQSRLIDQEYIDGVVKKYFNVARDDHEYGATHLLKNQKAAIRACFGKGYKLPSTTLAAFKPIQFTTGSQSETQHAVRIALEPASGKAKPANRRDYFRQTVKPTIYYDKPVHAVPGYSHYVSLEENMLAENVVQLTYFPYRGDDNLLSNDQYENELSSRYDFNPRIGSVEIQRISEAQQALPYVEDVMQSIGVTYEAILEYLLSPDDPCHHLDIPVPREASCNEDFDRDSRKWMIIYNSIRDSRDKEVQYAAMLCASWKLIWGWSLWHVVKISPPVEKVLRSARRKYARPENIRQMTCCVCLLVDCNTHGEILEFIDNEDEEEYERARFEAREKEERYIGANGIVPTHVKLRLPWHIENLNSINHRKYMVSLPRPIGERVPTEFPKKISTMFWRRTPESWDHYRRDPFYPCSHPGLCEDVKCSCWLAKVPCEKACACPGGCDRRISGCKCAQKGRPCSNREKCPCYALNRECDPDLCGKCGAKEVILDRADIHGDMCNNVMIRRNIPRKTHLGTSTIHGLGLFMGDDVQAGEYIGEYKGEIITKAEAERRALIYDQRGTSYLFGLNNKQDVDAMHKGNKMRFINHSNQRGIKNVHPKVMFVNMVHRIGMYASRNIKAGEELFFNYGWEKDKTEGFKSMKEGSSSAAAAAAVVAAAAAAAAGSANVQGSASTSGTTRTATPVEPASVASTAVVIKTKAKSKAKRPAAILLASTVPEENVVDVFENEGEYQGNSGDEEPDADQAPDGEHIDSDDDSYHGSDGEVESE